MSENWTRTEGVVVAAELDPQAVVAHLAGGDVVARLEWYPGTEQLLSVSVLSDGEHRVAIAPAGAAGVTPGPTLAELADDLATTFDADVLMEGVHVEGQDTDGDTPDWAVVDDHVGNGPVDARTVVLTSLAAHRVPVQANQLRRTVTTAPCTVGGAPRRLLMTTGDGAELGVLGWEEDAYPVLRLQVDDEDRTALLLVSPENDEDEGEDVVLFSWSMRSELVHGDSAANAAVREVAEQILGDGIDVAAFAAAVPGADAAAVAASLRVHGAQGLAAFVTALGLPAAVVDVLESRAEPDSLPDAVVHEPVPVAEPVEPTRPTRPAWLSKPAGSKGAGAKPGEGSKGAGAKPGEGSKGAGAKPAEAKPAEESKGAGAKGAEAKGAGAKGAEGSKGAGAKGAEAKGAEAKGAGAKPARSKVARSKAGRSKVVTGGKVDDGATPAAGPEVAGPAPDVKAAPDTTPQPDAKPAPDTGPTPDAKPALSAKAVAEAAKAALEERAAKPLPALTPGQQKWALRATLAGIGTAAAGAAVIAVIKGATKR
ncbi:hypothetical protein [Georgenia sp.]